jgi:hypothetical protein
MATIKDEINEAIKTLVIDKNEFVELENVFAKQLLNKIEDHFVELKNKRWWWECFRYPFTSVNFNNNRSFTYLSKVVPNPKEKVWFIAEEDQLPFFPIYEGNTETIERIIGECYAFEYYLVDKTFNWLLCETHHNDLIVIGKELEERLIKLAKLDNRNNIYSKERA